MRNITPERIVEKLTKVSGIDPYNNTRKREYVEIRALACWLMRMELGMRWCAITKIFSDNGKKMHHASAIYLVKNYPHWKKQNKALQDWQNIFHFIEGIDYEEVDRLHILEGRLSDMQTEYDLLAEQLEHPLVKLVYDISTEENKKDLIERIGMITKSWAWKQNKKTHVKIESSK